MSKTGALYNTATLLSSRRSAWCLQCRSPYGRSFPRCLPRRLASSAAVVHEVNLDSDAAVRLPSTAPSRPRTLLTKEQRQFLDSALRVNQAGELAAVLIYTAQTPLIVRSHPHLRTLMKHMYDQEVGHFHKFNELIAKHRIRPTIMYPLWRAAATALGWSTAVMGREAAMACTEAVETEIGEHYNQQVSVLLEWERDMEARGEEVSQEMRDMLSTLRRIRDEELEHLDHAVENDAKSAKPYGLLTNVIRGGCRAAIWITERV